MTGQPATPPPARVPPGSRVLACRVFLPELSLLGVPPELITCLDQGLHRHPDDLRGRIAAAVRDLEQDPRVRRVILVYGYCGGGLEGLTSERLELVVPAIHDCIALLLGRSTEPYQGRGGQSFFLSAGWIDHGATPFTEYQITAAKFGHEDALWVGREMLRAYDHVTLITGPQTDPPHYRDHARKAAGLFGLGYREEPGNLGWLRRLLEVRESGDIFVAPPGRVINAAMFPTDGVIPQESR